MSTIKTDVIIVGAGPTGLSLAIQLLRYGIDFVIVDKKEGTTDLSKAMVVHARTLEIYDQIGLAQTAVAQGAIVQNLALMHDGEVQARLQFSDVGGHLSPFPFLLVFEQSKNERLLNDHLQSAGKTVRWQTELKSITQDESGVKAEFQTADGETQTVEGRYLVGCDGASSATRHLLGLGFEGSTFPRLFYVADVDMQFDAEQASIFASFGTNAFVLFFPMQGQNHWRLIGSLPEYEHQAQATGDKPLEVPFEVIENKVRALMQRPLDITSVRWFSTYKVHTRHAETFSKGRCFVAGDAAHVHTPAGGQGMNTGIQDAYNLAWKLAFTIQGQTKESLLDTYNEERLANAKRLLQTTDQIFEVAADEHWQFQFFRDHILGGLASFMWRFDAVKEFLFPTISQIGIHYRVQSLSWHVGDTKVKAGDRMPYFEVDGASIYDHLRNPKFHLLVFTNVNNNYEELKAQVESELETLLEFHLLTLDLHITEIFGTDEPFIVLLRPDNHIGFLSSDVTIDHLNIYLKEKVKQ